MRNLVNKYKVLIFSVIILINSATIFGSVRELLEDDSDEDREELSQQVDTANKASLGALLSTVVSPLGVLVSHFRGWWGAPTEVRVKNIHEAAYLGDISAISAFLAAGADIHSLTTIGPGAAAYTPLHLAAMNNKPDAIKALVAAGAQVNFSSRNSVRATPLHMAAYGGNREAVDALLAVPEIDIHAVMFSAGGEIAQTPLSMALTQGDDKTTDGHIAIARILVNRGAYVTIRDVMKGKKILKQFSSEGIVMRLLRDEPLTPMVMISLWEVTGNHGTWQEVE